MLDRDEDAPVANLKDDWQPPPARHQIESPKRAPQEIAQGRLPQSDLPQ
jgi:hypothetical protein